MQATDLSHFCAAVESMNGFIVAVQVRALWMDIRNPYPELDVSCQPWVKPFLGKIPLPKGKLQRRWLKGVWLAKLDRDDSHVSGTGCHCSAVDPPLAKRIPSGQRTDE